MYGQYSEAPMGRGDGSVRVPANKTKRKRTVFPTDEIAHLWAHRTQDAARNPQGSFYFEGDTIYSYGSHFPIARHVTGANGQAGVLFTTRNYSSTTARHVSNVRSAIPHGTTVLETDLIYGKPGIRAAEHALRIRKLIEALKSQIEPTRKYPPLKRIEQKLNNSENSVPAFAGKRLCINQSGSSWTVTHMRSGFSIGVHGSRVFCCAILERLDTLRIWDQVPADGKAPREVLSKCAAAVDKARNAVKDTGEVNRHPSAIAKSFHALESAIASAHRFNEFFGYKARFEIPMDLEPARLITADWDAKATERRIRRESANQAEYERRMAESKLELDDVCAKWRNGERVYRWLYDVPVMLRVKGDIVETSKGATVPVSHARRGLAFVRQVVATGQEYVRNGHTLHLGHYAIDRITSDGTLCAGCHVISYQEIERIAPQLEQ